MQVAGAVPGEWGRALRCAVLGASGVVAAASSSDGPRAPECPNDESCASFDREAVDPGGETYVFVVDSVAMPDTATAAQCLGMDLDGDPQCRPDNALGQVLSTAFSQFDVDGTSTGNELIVQGRMLHLVEVQAASLVDADGVGVRIHVGIDEDGIAADNFSGVEAFAVDTQVAGEPMTGSIRDGVLTAQLGVVPLQIAIPRADGPSLITLVAARIEMYLFDDHVEARLAGALSEEDVDAVVELAWMAMADIIAEDCPAVCRPNSRGENILDLFDDNDDGTLTYDELRFNVLVASLLAPDLDLYDADGRFNPRTDEIKDHLSFGMSFTAVPARFASPPPAMPDDR